MWFIIDDQMADDRRIRRLPLATVGLWVKLCVIHSKGISMQAKDPAAYPGYFDKLDLKDAGGTMKQLQQLIDMGLMEEHGGGWRPSTPKASARNPRRSPRNSARPGAKPEARADGVRPPTKKPSNRLATC